MLLAVAMAGLFVLTIWTPDETQRAHSRVIGKTRAGLSGSHFLKLRGRVSIPSRGRKGDPFGGSSAAEQIRDKKSWSKNPSTPKSLMLWRSRQDSNLRPSV